MQLLCIKALGRKDHLATGLFADDLSRAFEVGGNFISATVASRVLDDGVLDVAFSPGFGRGRVVTASGPASVASMVSCNCCLASSSFCRKRSSFKRWTRSACSLNTRASRVSGGGIAGEAIDCWWACRWSCHILYSCSCFVDQTGRGSKQVHHLFLYVIWSHTCCWCCWW